jgi:hypothetical protein
VLTGGFSTAHQADQSDQEGYDRVEQVMVDVRYWHLADIDASAEDVRFCPLSGHP